MQIAGEIRRIVPWSSIYERMFVDEISKLNEEESSLSKRLSGFVFSVKKTIGMK